MNKVLVATGPAVNTPHGAARVSADWNDRSLILFSEITGDYLN